MSSMFHPGMKVVCVEDNWQGGPCPIKKGEIYTVSGFSPVRITDSFDGPMRRRGVVLKEVTNRESIYGCFNPSRFRPVVSKPTSIAVFKEMLITSKVGEPA